MTFLTAVKMQRAFKKLQSNATLIATKQYEIATTKTTLTTTLTTTATKE